MVGFCVLKRTIQCGVKVVSFWVTTIDACKNNPQKLWRMVNKLLHHCSHNIDIHCISHRMSVNDWFHLCHHLIWADHLGHILKQLSNLPAKSCLPFPTPTWLLKQLYVPMVPVISYLWNLSLWVGFNIVWSVLYERSEYNTLQTVLKRTYIHDPLSGCQLVGRSLKPKLVGVVTVQRSLFTHVGGSDAELLVVVVA